MLFFGDGKSIAGPIDAIDRTTLSADMVQNKIAFFSVPLVLTSSRPTCTASPTPPAAR